MPIVMDNDCVLLALGAGDVTIVHATDEHGHPYLAFAPMDRAFGLNEKVPPKIGMAHPPLLVMSFVNRAGIDNLISFLSAIRNDVRDLVEPPEEEAQHGTTRER